MLKIDNDSLNKWSFNNKTAASWVCTCGRNHTLWSKMWDSAGASYTIHRDVGVGISMRASLSYEKGSCSEKSIQHGQITKGQPRLVSLALQHDFGCGTLRSTISGQCTPPMIPPRSSPEFPEFLPLPTSKSCAMHRHVRPELEFGLLKSGLPDWCRSVVLHGDALHASDLAVPRAVRIEIDGWSL